MKTERLPTRDQHENRFEREEKLGTPLESLPGKTLRDRETGAKQALRRSTRPRSGFDMTIMLRPPAVAAPARRSETRAPVTFRLFAPEAAGVYVAGTFNQWDPQALPLSRQADGVWSQAVHLPEGTHEYRFVVDGSWREDPLACDSVPNPFGSRNSLKRVG